jgi:hypothetical protein
VSSRLFFAFLSISSFLFGYTYGISYFFSTKSINDSLKEPLELNLHGRDGEGQLKVLEYRRVHDTESTHSLRLIAELDVNSSRVASEESRVCSHKLVS